MDAKTELRKLPADCLSFVEETLETNEDWKEFMSCIPDNLENLNNVHYEPKYNSEDIMLIENHATERQMKCAKVLFIEWGTSGRVRPTLETLLALLVKANMFRAADAVARIMGIPPPERPPSGPPAVIDTNVSRYLNSDSTAQFDTTTTDHHGNRSTEELRSFNLIEFSRNVDSIMQQPAQSEQGTSASNMIQFSVDTFLPTSDILNPKSNINNISSSTLSSIGESDSIQTIPQTLGGQSQSSNFNDHLHTDILQNDNLIQFAYEDLKAITNNFTETLIGTGGFGDVFLGNHDGLGLVAVKRVHNSLPLEFITKMFNSEVRSLSLLNHINIVPILGFSLDGQDRCIVCEYINGGSLKTKIADKVLTKEQRLGIMKGTAEGLKYVHNTVKPNTNPLENFIHGDVKSANILLTNDCIPKLCDFGLAKHFDNTYITSNIMGTRYYMSPESLSGTITQKGDVYSFGIVVLELLTGLEPIVNHGSAIMNIKYYLKEYCINGDITPFVDNVVGEWVEAQHIYDMVKLCLADENTMRPTMNQICIELQKF